jgi:hypothetical protein|tara:strand:- start:295 stop:474 length:180 start_codon:yes stop_codon:yes gene_type:complete
MKYRAEYHIMWARTDVEADSEEEAIEKIENNIYVEMEKGVGMEFVSEGEITDIVLEEEE